MRKLEQIRITVASFIYPDKKDKKVKTPRKFKRNFKAKDLYYKALYKSKIVFDKVEAIYKKVAPVVKDVTILVGKMFLMFIGLMAVLELLLMLGLPIVLLQILFTVGYIGILFFSMDGFEKIYNRYFGGSTLGFKY